MKQPQEVIYSPEMQGLAGISLPLQSSESVNLASLIAISASKVLGDFYHVTGMHILTYRGFSRWLQY